MAMMVAQKESGLKQKLVMFTLDDPLPMLYTNETVWRNDKRVGDITSGAYGFIVGSAVGMAYISKQDNTKIDNEWIMKGSYEIEVEGKRIPAKVHIKSPYDPDNKRLKM